MDIQEKIYTWQSMNNFASNFYIRSLSYDYDGLRIILEEEDNNKKKFVITFPSVRAYRETNITLLSPEHRKVNASEFFEYTVSDYLKWASHSSHGVSECLDLVHYAIYTRDTAIDVLTHRTPLVTLSNIE